MICGFEIVSCGVVGDRDGRLMMVDAMVGRSGWSNGIIIDDISSTSIGCDGYLPLMYDAVAVLS
jgi:hypothetical protein